MTSSFQPAWLRGPMLGIPAMLQPVAHALVDADEDVQKFVPMCSPGELSVQFAGTASLAYHVTHAIGSLDRLFTYASGRALDEAQLAALAAEKAVSTQSFTADDLVAAFSAAVLKSHQRLREVAESDLLTTRLVGRAQLPSNTIGLLVHAAEHTARHVGQIVTTVKIVRGTA